MKKKIVHHHKKSHTIHHASSRGKDTQQYLVVVRGWMFLVMFALMLGAGVILGNVINQKINESTPTVAGAQTEIAK